MRSAELKSEFGFIRFITYSVVFLQMIIGYYMITNIVHTKVTPTVQSLNEGYQTLQAFQQDLQRGTYQARGQNQERRVLTSHITVAQYLEDLRPY